jgi:hypothetical protein
VHTNSEAECFQDYKYFEDKSELKREVHLLYLSAFLSEP